jgi:hypothetical protein
MLMLLQEVFMFTADYQEFKLYQKELHQQAEQYRLCKSVKKANPWFSALIIGLGRILVVSGQQMINRYQTAS